MQTTNSTNRGPSPLPEARAPEALGNYGERQDSECRDWGYYAHLSIYEFAVRLVGGKQCLEIGCGTGYGSAHLAKRGAASVHAVDKAANVIDVLAKRHQNVNFVALDLDKGGLPYDSASFDVVFSSNVFEHIAYIDPVIDECRRVLRPTGVAVIAVPPIVTAPQLRSNASNVFHINNIPTWAWRTKLSRYFQRVDYFRHWVIDAKSPDGMTISRDAPTLTDFIFEPGDITSPKTITSVFVCEHPRQESLPQTELEDCPPEWLSLNLSAEARQSAFVDLQKAHDSTTQWWRTEISQLYRWAEREKARGTPAEVIRDGILRQLSIYVGDS